MMEYSASEGRIRLERDALARYLGIELLEMAGGVARTRMAVTPELLNGMDLTHGSAVFALADYALAAASNSHGQPAVSMQMNIYFLRTTRVGAVLEAAAREDSQSRRTGLYRVEVREENGKLVAVADGLVSRLGEAR